MRKEIRIAIAALVTVALTACGSAQPEPTPAAPTAPAAAPTGARSEPTAGATIAPAAEAPAAPAQAVTAVKPLFIDFYAPW